MLEFILVMLAIVALGLIALVATSVFVAYITQAQYIDEGYDDHDD
jgi:uncharacterized protein involved in cysteine biosynthesis